MGVLNITNDSFYAGSRYPSQEKYLVMALKMAEEGADIIDIGAYSTRDIGVYSTRPGAIEIDEKTEAKHLIEAIKTIRAALPEMVISADTFRSKVARSAVEAGADIINDISGGTLDNWMFQTVADLRVPYILMHTRGTPQTMNSKAVYKDLVGEIVFELSAKVNALRELGVADIIIDPGFGFAKTAEQNFELLKRLEELTIFNAPILVGISRKTMIWRTLGITPDEALNGTTAINILALQNGGNILRVHDVKPAREVIKLYETYRDA